MIKAYASYFTSYLLLNLKNIDNILSVILFGSVAKDEADRKSDVDIFIEFKKKNKRFEKEIMKITENFYKSREALIFKSKRIENKINIIIGRLGEWKSLEKSIGSTGITLYGKYVSPKFKLKGKKYLIFFWDKIGKNRGAFLNKIYGFTSGGKKYKGLLEIFEGKKLGKSSIMIPIEYREEIIKLIKYYNVNSRIIEVYY